MTRVWMVVEDDPRTRSIYVMMLTMWGVKPLVFPNGEDAAAWLDRVDAGEADEPLPEIAIIDVRLPGMMGYDVARRMRELPATRQIPLLMVTAYSLSETESMRIHEAAQPDLLLPKPLPMPDDFRALLERLIEVGRFKQQEMSGSQTAEQAGEPSEP